ncbi:MAG: YihY family inner membrane protein [Phycisphaera sp.]|nr:MAG: YihY family inner membrane protein [Phycisphaera sp.]
MNATQEQSPKFSDTVRVLRAGLRGIYRSRLPQMSAALAFRTLFALIPILVISVAAIGAFADNEDVREIMYQTLDTLGISDIEVPQAVEETPEEDGSPTEGDEVDPASDQPVSDPGSVTQEATGDQSAQAQNTEGESEGDTNVRLDELLTELIDRLLGLSFAAIGAIGMLTLIYAAISMLIEIERAFNNVYRAQIGKSWGKRIIQYWAIITLVPILLFSAFYASEQFRGLGVRLTEAESGTFLSYLAPFVGSVVSVAITSLLLLLAYTIIPNTRVHLKTGVVGAIVAAVLWEVAKWGFRLYLSYSASYAKIYGGIAVLPLFMLWVYLTWLIILFGLQVAYGLQHIELARRIDEEDADDRLTDPAAVFGVLAVIAERFARGKTASVSRITGELSLSAEAVGTMLDKLSRAEILRDVDGRDDRYVLARPAESITLEDAVSAMHDITDAGRGPGGAWTPAIDRLEQAREEAIKGMTVADLIEGGERKEEGKEPS